VFNFVTIFGSLPAVKRMAIWVALAAGGALSVWLLSFVFLGVRGQLGFLLVVTPMLVIAAYEAWRLWRDQSS
jgi:hypothetical protein